MWSKGHGNHTGQDETRVITCFFALSVPWSFYTWEQVHGDSLGTGGVSGIWCSGDNQFVYMSLSSEPIQPCDSPRLVLLGGSLLLTHNEVWDEAIVIELYATFKAWNNGWQWKGSHLLSLVTLALSSGYFPHLECFSPSFLHGRVLLNI